MKIALGHKLGGAAVVALGLTTHLTQLRRAVTILEDGEHAATIDARKLPVVADQNQLGARGVGEGRDLRHQLRVDHGGFVDHEDRAAVPRRCGHS